MTQYLINLTKHLSDSTFDTPFLYDLYEEGQLYFLPSKMDQVSVKLNRFANHLMRNMRTNRTKEWRLIVLVELFLEKEAHHSNFRAFSVLIQEILIQKIVAHGWKKPKEVVFIWIDQSINDNISQVDTFQQEAILLDKNGTPPVLDSLNIQQIFEALDAKWEKAKSIMGVKNPDRIDHFKKEEIYKIILNIKDDITAFFDELILQKDAMQIQGFDYLNIKELEESKLQSIEWFENFKGDKNLWQKFSPQQWLKELFHDRFSLDALSKHHKFYFFRLSHKNWPDDKISLYLFLREMIQSDKIIDNYKQNLSPNWVQVDLSKEGFNQTSCDYIAGLDKESFELKGIKSEMEKELYSVEQFTAPQFIQADDTELEQIILNRFNCSWFREENTFSRLLNWVEDMRSSLLKMEKSMPSIIQKTYRNNTQIPYSSEFINKNEQDWDEQIKLLNEQYIEQQNKLRNVINDNYIKTFDEYIESIKERIKSLFFVRPTSIMFVVSFILLGLLLAIPAWFGLAYHEVEATSPIYIGGSIIAAIILSFVVLYLFFKPLRQFLDEIRAQAVHAKNGIYQEFQRQQNYIKNIIQLRVTRMNIEKIKTLLDTIRMEKQQIEYVNKEINQHKDLISNKLRDMSLHAHHVSVKNPDKKRKQDFIGKRFSAFPFAMLSNYLEAEKYNIIIDELPEESISKMGLLIEQIEIKEDILFKSEDKFG